MNIYVSEYIYIYIYVNICVSTYIYIFSLFNGISTFVGHLMPKPYFKKNRNGTLLRGKSPSRTSIFDMTQSRLIVKLQLRSFGECEVLLHWYYSQIHYAAIR